MRQVQLSDQLFDETEQLATSAGFTSVDEYVADVLRHRLHPDTEDYDQLFTPERLTIIDKAVAQIEAGDTFTDEEVCEHFKQKFNAWPMAN